MQNRSSQDLRTSGGDFCGGLSNNNFGTLNPGLVYSDQLLYDNRPWDTQVGIAIQQQLAARIAVEVQYNKRWFYGQYVTRNLAVQPSDWTSYNLTAPVDSRLPNGGGYPVNGLYDIDPTLFGRANYEVQPSANYGNDSQVLERRRRELQRTGRPVASCSRAAPALARPSRISVSCRRRCRKATFPLSPRGSEFPFLAASF